MKFLLYLILGLALGLSLYFYFSAQNIELETSPAIPAKSEEAFFNNTLKLAKENNKPLLIVLVFENEPSRSARLLEDTLNEAKVLEKIEKDFLRLNLVIPSSEASSLPFLKAQCELYEEQKDKVRGLATTLVADCEARWALKGSGGLADEDANYHPHKFLDYLDVSLKLHEEILKIRANTSISEEEKIPKIREILLDSAR